MYSKGNEVPSGYPNYGAPQSPVSSGFAPPYAAPAGPAVTVYQPAAVAYTVPTVPFLGHDPVSIQCPQCNSQIVTSVQHDPGAGTVIMGGIICLLGGVFGCCLIPCCIPSCQDTTHRCPSCGASVGHRKFL